MANGTGYLRQRSKGSWTITMFLGKDEKGKPRQLVKTVRGTETEAKAEMARLTVERDQGVDLKPETVTFAALAERWLATKVPDLSDSTAATYETLLRVHIVPVLGGLKLRDLKPLHMEAVKTAVLKAGDGSKSALNVFRLLTAVLDQAIKWQLIQRNPCEAVQAPRAKQFIPHIPNMAQLETLLRVADGTPYGPVARMAALTGARQGELLRLRWRDVDWQEARLGVPGTKTRASARTIDLGPMAVELLRSQRSAEREKKLLLGPEANCAGDDATIFTNLVGKPMDAGGLKRSWKRIVRDAHVGHVRFHDLRHCMATYLLQAGVPVQIVSQRLGHSRTSTTTDIYAHVLPGMGKEAAQILERVMQG
jgi:integrase